VPDAPSDQTAVRGLLAAAVEALGGAERSGQIQMAEAVGGALAGGEHLLVQAGTGTGKSLAYLVPSLLHDQRVVVATATLALQHQLVERDLPRLVEALDGRGLDTSFAVLKGRSNYACLHRIREGVPDDQGTLQMDVPMGDMAAKVLELRGWAEEQAESHGTGERDFAPRHTDREWRQVSVTHRDCLGAAKCPFGQECFAERAREKAQRSHLIVTNHSLLAIDAIEGIPMIPEYDAVVIDEAHELVARVTQAATDELAPSDVERAARRSRRYVEGAVDGQSAEDLADAADTLRDAMAEASPGRFETPPADLHDALVLVRDAARAALSAYPKKQGQDEQSGDAGLQQAKGSVQEVFGIAERMAANAELDVLWMSEGGDRMPSRLHVAPLQVWGPMRDRLLTDKTVVFTSATLKLGGDFDTVAGSLGLRPGERSDGEAPSSGRAAGRSSDGEARSNSRAADGEGDGALPWRGLDVGSPFDYGKQAILYVARHLPPPGRDGLGQAQMDEIVELVDAADGRALGLFSSRRAAEAAAEVVRTRLPHLTTLAQGDAQLPELAAQFVGDPHTVLFGTLSLWQGLDVPGDTCQLVLIDRIPFPRPDDPLMSARQRAADKAGGNGFMQVAATHAALLLAQGSGRLIRTTSDRGVVAVLDPRLATARYGGFLKASLPPMWPTSDPAVARQALKRLSEAASSPSR
jgi:ATP-dependent DNA helicase DinG